MLMLNTSHLWATSGCGAAPSRSDGASSSISVPLPGSCEPPLWKLLLPRAAQSEGRSHSSAGSPSSSRLHVPVWWKQSKAPRTGALGRLLCPVLAVAGAVTNLPVPPLV